MSDTRINRFKQAFRGTLAQRETPLLAHRITLPDSVQGCDRVTNVLLSLDKELDDSASDVLGKRTGKKFLGKTWTKNSSSSLKNVADALGDQVDTDLLEQVTNGKGQTEAQQALRKIKDVEKQLQKAVTDELLEQVATARDALEATDRLNEVLDFLSKPTINVDGGFDDTVRRLGDVLATHLRINPTDLPGMDADDLKAAYLDNVVAPLKMERKAARDPGLVKKIDDLVKRIAQIPADKLTAPGDAASIVALVQAAQLNNSAAINQARAGKFSVGAQETRPKKVKSSSNGNSCDVVIQGNKRFADLVDTAVTEIDGTPEGQLLLEALAATGKDVSIIAPSISSAQRVGTSGTMLFSNSAGKGSVAFDPENDITGEDVSKVAAEPWRQRDPSVALYHEMIHALIGNMGGEEWTATDKKTKLTLSEQGDITELRIVGIDYEQATNDGKALFPFSDPKYNPISENAFRRGLAKKNGAREVYLRPSYANVAGQVKLSNDKTVI